MNFGHCRPGSTQKWPWDVILNLIRPGSESKWACRQAFRAGPQMAGLVGKTCSALDAIVSLPYDRGRRPDPGGVALAFASQLKVLGCYQGTQRCCHAATAACCARAAEDCSAPEAPLMMMADVPAALGNVLQALHDAVIVAKALERVLLLPPLVASIDLQHMAEAR